MMRLSAAIIGVLAVLPLACGGDEHAPADRRTAQVDEQVRQRWGVSLAELPTVMLQVISPHNENVQSEFGWAFSLHHALQFGQKVQIVWRDVGGGGSAIQRYLQNVYASADTCGIDVLWGGGDMVFTTLSCPTERHPDGIFQPMHLAEDVLANIPLELHGQRFYDPNMRWVGSALSGFGFLYNAELLRRCGIAPPRLWEDLGDARFTDLVELADPAQSASVTAIYVTIVRSESTWPAGWARLVGVLGNAKRIADAASAAANAPVLGDALVAASIDFYGLTRVAEAPDKLKYVSPEGQTAFTCDPIGILKNPPDPVLAQRLVDFVMSVRGQALWALPVGVPDGPVHFALGRQPIRRDVYDLYRGRLIASIANPYQPGAAMAVHGKMEEVNVGVVRRLVVAAAVDNIDALRAARKALNRLQADPARQDEYRRRLAIFNALPDDVDTPEEANSPALWPKDPRRMHLIDVGWRDFFRRNYREVASQW